MLYDDVKQKIRSTKSPYIVKSYGYVTFKLFVLSLLWRASISRLNAFKYASLGVYENNLREILYSGLAAGVRLADNIASDVAGKQYEALKRKAGFLK